MPLSPSARLGPYEILAAIGAGGMGEVYNARDTRLGRVVAIKVLRADVAADPERRRRFEQEARAVSALNHPHICVLHDIGREGDTDFLVMEYLEGQTLAERLAKGPLPLPEVLQIGSEIADALSVAHKHGIIHRDLKPANVMLTKVGGARSGPWQAKLLDFGLARLTQASSASGASGTLTDAGVPKGTAPYMAPEQIEGRETDARTDLFTFGAVLYEMLTGTRAFEGLTPASTMAAILEHEPPPISSIQPLTPPALDHLVRECLAKSPDDRPDSAHDLASELRWIGEGGGAGAVTSVGGGRRQSLRTGLLVATGTLLFVAGLVVMSLLRPPGLRVSVVRSSLDVGPAEELNAGGYASPSTTEFVPAAGGSQTAVAWTPDGATLVYVGRRNGVQQLYLRRLDAAESQPVPGTEGAQEPAVSPDGQWIAFWSRGAIQKVALAGGPVMELVGGLEYAPSGLAWDGRGALYFGRVGGKSFLGSRICRLSVDGLLSEVTKLGDAELAHSLPWPLPGGEALLYTVRKRGWTWGDEEIVAQKFATGERHVLLQQASDARYVPTGHLVFMRNGELFAVPFDVERLKVPGPPVPVLDTVAQALMASDDRDCTGAGQFAIAATGTLAWVQGRLVPYPDSVLVSVDRHGRVSPLATPARGYRRTIRIAPDSRRVAVTVRTLTEVGLWLYDLDRGTPTPLALGGEVDWPAWTPDGQRVVFGWLKDGRYSLASRRADGTLPLQVLLNGAFVPSSWTPDARELAGTTPAGDVVVATFENERATVRQLFQQGGTEYWPEFSPDGRWLAYGSNVSGRSEIYVQPYPSLGPATQVSIGGGQQPAWNRANGRELFYVTTLPDPAGKLRLVAVGFQAGRPPGVGPTQELFTFDPKDLGFFCGDAPRCYDVGPDGQRFYAVQARTPVTHPPVTHINIVENWFNELKTKVPVR